MNKEQAVELVKKTFDSEFEKSKFHEFIKKFLDGIDESEAYYDISPKGEMFRNKIKSCTKIGQYRDSKHNEIDVLSVQVADGVSLDRSRTMLRDFIASYMEKSFTDYVIAAFWRKDSPDWRFSLITKKYNLVENSLGISKPKQEFSSPRRHSFLVGKNEMNHTVHSRMLQLLVKEKPSISDIMDAFNEEKVSEEFFACYKECLQRLVETLDDIRKKDEKLDKEFEKFDKKFEEEEKAKNFEKDNKESEEKYKDSKEEAKKFNNVFCEKLLSQLVFLYFIQKKGWLGVELEDEWGKGNKQFLRDIFKLADKNNNNFFNDCLTPLFYNALAKQREGDVFDILNSQVKIPFLNGGLFDPVEDYDWENIPVPFDNELFSNHNKTKEGDDGDGILDIFDRYNFTVREDEPLEKEVAVDPEMLGKIFEKILNEKQRKDKGAFYTPREIVHYICQESLINYLFEKLENVSKEDVSNFIRNSDSFSDLPKSIEDNLEKVKTALASVKVCDPAIGSGAFPVGILTEIVKARMSLVDSDKKEDPNLLYQYKLETIQNSIYGVDLDGGAVEIARLRLWLSLVVDEENPKEIKPLPNFDFKIMEGNSLLYVMDEENPGFVDDEIKKLEKLKDEFFYESSEKKKEIRKKIKDRIINWTGSDIFDFKAYFSEVFNENGGFDIVIGNPPYVQLQSLKEEYPQLQKKYKDTGFEVHDSNGDIYCLFYEKGTDILKQGGYLCYITSNKWMRAGYGEKLRRYFVQKTQPLLLIDFAGTKIFKDATVDTNILLLKKESGGEKTLACTFSDRELSKEQEKECLNNLSDFVNQYSISQRFDSGSWCILNPIEQNIKNKIEKIGTPLKDWDIKIYRGILTGLNDAFIIDGKKKEGVNQGRSKK